jgi:hypothetical protein
MNYAKRGSAAGTAVIDGGMNTSIAGIRSAIGMTTITTATSTESSRVEENGVFSDQLCPPRNVAYSRLLFMPV